MSRAYLLKVPLNLVIPESELSRRGIVKIQYDLCGILSPARMNEILKKVLLEKDWKEGPEGLELKKDDGTILRLHPESHQLEIDLTLVISKEVHVSVLDDHVPNIRAILEGGDTSAIGLNPVIQTKLKEAWADLNEREREMAIGVTLQAKQNLNQTLKEVYREAIKEKAASMGNVVSLSESSEGGNYRIRLEIK